MSIIFIETKSASYIGESLGAEYIEVTGVMHFHAECLSKM